MKLKNIIKILIMICAIIIIILGLLIKNEKFWITSPFELFYSVKGVDVSSYQGQIDWQILSKQGIKFAYIKATEGSTFQDKNFQYNWKNANDTDLRIGAYHFFSFDSPGKTQADNFISIVTKSDNMLPPVIDLEFYKDKKKNPPSREETHKILKELLENMEDYYKVKPIIYATRTSYRQYIKGDFEEYDIWIRNLFFYPILDGKRKWKFWQYNNIKKLKGYKGIEKNIDMNFFNGNIKEFEKYGKENQKIE